MNGFPAQMVIFGVVVALWRKSFGSESKSLNEIFSELAPEKCRTAVWPCGQTGACKGLPKAIRFNWEVCHVGFFLAPSLSTTNECCHKESLCLPRASSSASSSSLKHPEASSDQLLYRYHAVANYVLQSQATSHPNIYHDTSGTRSAQPLVKPVAVLHHFQISID